MSGVTNCRDGETATTVEMTPVGWFTVATWRCTKNALRQRPHVPARVQLPACSQLDAACVRSAHPSGQTRVSTAGNTPMRPTNRIAQARRTAESVSRFQDGSARSCLGGSLGRRLNEPGLRHDEAYRHADQTAEHDFRHFV